MNGTVVDENAHGTAIARSEAAGPDSEPLFGEYQTHRQLVPVTRMVSEQNAYTL